jgi:hypothetical protein
MPGSQANIKTQTTLTAWTFLAKNHLVRDPQNAILPGSKFKIAPVMLGMPILSG